MILVLEDNPVQCAIFDKILQSGGFKVRCLQDPREFLNNLDTTAVPSLVLLDIVLPGTDGVAVLDRLERHPLWCEIPTVLMTSTPTADRVRSAQRLPVLPEGFLVKPIEPMKLLQSLQAILSRAEPVHLLRAQQRTRLKLLLETAAEASALEKSLLRSQEGFTEARQLLAEFRSELDLNRVADLTAARAGSSSAGVPDSPFSLFSQRLDEIAQDSLMDQGRLEALRTKIEERAELEAQILSSIQSVRGGGRADNPPADHSDYGDTRAAA